MIENLNGRYSFISSEKMINEFIESKKNTLKIIEAMESQLKKHFPDSKFSMEICDKLGWTTETKLLVNVQVNEEMFFNGMLEHLNDIYNNIKPVIDDIENTVVIFPEIENKHYNKLDNNSVINLVARTAYFNNYNNGLIQREMSFRNIPKEQQKKEIIMYCKTHKNPNISDIMYDLQLELFEVDDAITELEEQGIKLNVEY